MVVSVERILGTGVGGRVQRQEISTAVQMREEGGSNDPHTCLWSGINLLNGDRDKQELLRRHFCSVSISKLLSFV